MYSQVVPDLSSRQRIAVARLSGAVSRMTGGGLRDLDRRLKLARIRAISTDPLVLGEVMGPLLAPEYPDYAAADAEAIGLLRECGADEARAEVVAEDLRARNWGHGLGG